MSRRSLGDNGETTDTSGASTTRDASFLRIWYRFQNSTPRSYPRMSMRVCTAIHGPDFPSKAFHNLDALIDWYSTILGCWLIDALLITSLWRGKLPCPENELGLIRLALEARATGLRRLHYRVFRQDDGIPRQLPINSYEELSRCCDFFFQLLDDDEANIERERQTLTIRYDKGVAYRLGEERRQAIASGADEWAVSMTYNLLGALSRGESRKMESDDDWVLTVWSGLADAERTILDVVTCLFVDAHPQPKQPHRRLYEEMVAMVWRVMRRLGPVCHEEPQVSNARQVRKQLDLVKLFCSQNVSPLPQPFIERANEQDATPDNQAAEQILTGYVQVICGEANQIYRDLTKFDNGIDGEIEFKDANGNPTGKKIYLQLKNGASYLRHRKSDGNIIFDVRNRHHLIRWRSQPVDVYLVVRDSGSVIRWMNVTRYLNNRQDKDSRQVIFNSEVLDTPAVMRLRDRILAQTKPR